MNNEIKMKIISDNSLNMKLTDSKAIDMNVSSTGKEVDPIFRNSPAYTITYNDITYWNNKSNFSGNYNDLKDKPLIPTTTSQLTNDSGFITKNVNNLANYTLSANLSTVATTGDYDDLLDKPTIPTKTSDLDNDSGFIDNTVNDLTNYTLTSDLATVATTGDYSDLLNTPTLATVATSGLYSDLLNKPTLATVASTGDYDDLIDKPTLATVATTGDYDDLIDKPSIPTVPTNVSAFNNDAGYITNTVNDLTNYTLSSSLASVATSGSYNDLSSTPTIPTAETLNVYSTTEQVVGKWIDGKTLYRKVFTDTMPNCTTDGTLVISQVSISSLNADTIFFESGFFVGSPYGDISINPLPFSNPSDTTKVASMDIYGNYLEIKNNRVVWSSYTYYISVLYTKSS